MINWPVAAIIYELYQNLNDSTTEMQILSN